MTDTDLCPCCSGQAYTRCCGRYLDQGAYPQTAETLMRSRYSAYTRADVGYLQKTWHPDTCPVLEADDLRQTEWLKLDVIRHQPGLKKAIVEFRAYYREGTDEVCLHEVSLFKKVKQRWVYLHAENFSRD